MAEGIPADIDYRINTDRLDPVGVQLLHIHAQNGWQILPNTSEESKLRWWEAAAVIANRMIGTGVYTTPTLLILKTRMVGTSLVLWCLGSLATLSATLMYSEYGLTIPRVLDPNTGERVPLPSNGGELNYTQYLLDRPKFFAAFLFGVPFILIGSSAANAISFAKNFLKLCSPDTDPLNEHIFLLAIAAVALTCFVHATYRTVGIYANTIFAGVKVVFLLVILGAGLSQLHHDPEFEMGDRETDRPYTQYCSLTPEDRKNPGTNSFVDPFTSTNGLGAPVSGIATAYLQVVFSYGGFQQANYILSDVFQPRKTFMRTSLLTVCVVCVLYILVAFAFFGIVPVKYILGDDAQYCRSKWEIGSEFFQITMGQRRIYNFFLMISSFGNIVVTTFTMARVKQEIAKTGILGNFATFFGNNYNVVAIVARWTRRATHGIPTHQTPAAALLLHFISSVILIAAVWSILEDDGYTTLTIMYSYAIDSFFAAFLGLGLLCMRFPWRKQSEDSWSVISAVHSAPLSTTAASVALVINVFPLVAVFLGLNPDKMSVPEEKREAITTIGVGLGILVVGIISWALFNWLWVRDRVFRVERAPILYTDATGEIQRAFDNFRIVWEDPQPLDPSEEGNHFHLKSFPRRRVRVREDPVV